MNIIPLLEFDPNPTAVIMPGHEKMDLKLPEKVVYAFLGDAIDRYALSHDAKVLAEFVSSADRYPIYEVQYKDYHVGLIKAPVGAPAAVQILDRLIAYGAKQIISGGSCGVLEAIKENSFLIPVKALRDEGTSYHYVAPKRFITIQPEAISAIKKTMESYGLEYHEVITWTTDGFYRETRAKVAARKEEGCSVVEMECSAMAACAAMRKVIWGEILFTADSLANPNLFDTRDRGRASIDPAVELCLDAVCNV